MAGSTAALAGALLVAGPASAHEASFAHLPSAGELLVLGVEHILLGWDHLLFLLALLIGCTSLRAVAGVVSAFTLAHSLTLAAATFGWVALPAHIVEPVIAASIVYAALSSWIGPSGRIERWAVTFGFGLIHGLGFAGALAELGAIAPDAPGALSLLAFNAGVELGQLAVAALALPLLGALRRQAVLGRRLLPAGAACTAAAGLFWLVERTLL